MSGSFGGIPSGGPVRQELKPALKPLQVGALALGCVIGFGAFVLAGDFLAIAGPLGAALGVFVGGLAMMVITMSYGLLVRTFPVAGGEFAYAYHSLGRYHAYFCGWLLALGYICIVPLNATALAVLGKFIAPQIFERWYLYTIAGFDVFAGEILLASAAIILVGYFQQRGAREVGMFQLVLTATLVGAVAMIGIGTAVDDQAALVNLQPLFNPDRSAIGAILAIVAISPWLYVGFDTLPQAAEEFDFSPRQGRNLMLGSIVAGGVMYIIVILATGAVMPWREMTMSGSIWGTGMTVQSSLGNLGLTILVVAVCMAVLTGINGFFVAGSRLLFGMGRAKILPAWFGYVHPTRGTPINAIVFTGLLSLFAPWFGREVILWIVDMAAVGTSVAFLYTCFAAFVVAGQLKEEGMVMQKGLALLGILLSAGFLLLLLVPGMPGFMSMPSWLALAAWLALGLAFFIGRASHLRSLSKEEMDFMIFGKKE